MTIDNHNEHDDTIAELEQAARLEQQAAELQRQAAELRARGVSRARAKVLALMAKHSVKIEDLIDDKHKHKRKGRPMVGAGQPKYRDPVSGKTWSGLGTAPGWIKDRTREEREQYRIEKSA